MAVNKVMFSRDFMRMLQQAVAPCALNFAAVYNDHTKYLLQLKYGEHTWEYPLDLDPPGAVGYDFFQKELVDNLRTMSKILQMDQPKEPVYHYPSQLHPVEIDRWWQCKVPYLTE